MDFARMPTVRCILKYTPAAMMGLLVEAWAFTQGGWMQFCSGQCVIALQHGSVTGYRQESDKISFFWTSPKEWRQKGVPQLGRIRTANPVGATGYWFPIPLLCTLILPLAIGPLLSFRFRLWHCFAYTALVAVELAYYLRWQG